MNFEVGSELEKIYETRNTFSFLLCIFCRGDSLKDTSLRYTAEFHSRFAKIILFMMLLENAQIYNRREIPNGRKSWDKYAFFTIFRIGNI